MTKEPIKLPAGTTVAADLATMTDWMKKTGVKSIRLNGGFGDGIGDDYDPQWSVWAEGLAYGSPESAALKANERLVARIAVGLATNMGSLETIAASSLDLEIASGGALKLEQTSGLGRKTTRTQFSAQVMNAPYKGELLHGASLDIFHSRLGEKMPQMQENPADDLATLRSWMSERGITAASSKISGVFQGKWGGDVYFDGNAGNGSFSGFGSRLAALAALGIEAAGSEAMKGKNPDEVITLHLTQDRFYVSPKYGRAIEIDAAVLAPSDFRVLRDGRIAGLEIPAFKNEANLTSMIPTYLGKTTSPELAVKVNTALQSHGIVDEKGYSVVEGMFLDRVEAVVVKPGYEDKIGQDLLAGINLRTINGVYPATTSEAPEREFEHAFYVPNTAIGPVLLSGNGSRQSGYIVRNDLHAGNYLLTRAEGFPDMSSVKGPHNGRQCDAYEVTFKREGGEVKNLKVKDILLQGSLTYLRENLRLFSKLCEHFSAGLDEHLRVVAQDETSAKILGSAKFMAMRTDTDALATFSRMVLNPPAEAKASIAKWMETGDTRDLYQVRDDLGIERDLKGQNIIGEIDASVSYGRRAMMAHQFSAACAVLDNHEKKKVEPEVTQPGFDF